MTNADILEREKPGVAGFGPTSRADLVGTVENGLTHHRQGNFPLAEAAYRSALALAPEDGAIWKLLGIALRQQDRLADAIVAMTRAVQHSPGDADAHRTLSRFQLAAGEAVLAVESARAAVTLGSEDADNHLALGEALRAAKRHDDAIRALSEAVRLSPESQQEAILLLGHSLCDAGHHRQATVAYRKILGSDPGQIDALNGLGIALYKQGDFDGACRCYSEAYARAPEAIEALVNYANILLKTHRLGEALALYEHALALRPTQVETVYNYANCLDFVGRLDDAIVHYDRALALKPDHINAFWNRTLTQLTAGRLRESWAAYERRWEVPSFVSPKVTFSKPMWDGEALGGRTLLLHGEQGFGDTIQFVRYAPMIAERGGRVVVRCQKELVRLLQGAPGVTEVHGWEEELPPYDVHLPMMSVCHRFGTSIDTIPSAIPYLRAEPMALPEPGLLNVGLVWAGNPTHLNDANRSIPRPLIECLLGVENARFYGLQFGVASPLGPELVDLTPELKDFADTASALASLDLLISVDTSAAHLAGALGRPTLMLLPTRNDWRWFKDREDTPWYPTMRLLRQTRSGDWTTVVARARAMVEELARTRRAA